MSLALLFPGQGSQFPGMGRDLAAAYPEAARVFERADDILGFSLSRLAREGPEDQLVQTHNAQPAILVHSLAALAVLKPRLGPIACAAGHSLGEISAHAAAGTLQFDDAVYAVRRRGELMREAGRARPGSMAAILGLGEPEVREVCRAVSGKGWYVFQPTSTPPRRSWLAAMGKRSNRFWCVPGKPVPGGPCVWPCPAPSIRHSWPERRRVCGSVFAAYLSDRPSFRSFRT